MPFILLLEILLISVFGDYLPLAVKQNLYGFGMTILSAILGILPVVIFGLLFNVAVSLSRSASRLIPLIIVGVFVSNYVAVFVSHYAGEFVYGFDLSLVAPEAAKTLNLPSWYHELPRYLSNQYALLLGLGLGLLLAKFWPIEAQKLSDQLGHVTHRILKTFTMFIPLFVAGLMIRLSHEGSIALILSEYLKIVSVMLVVQLAYVVILYWIGNGFQFTKTIHSIRHMLPAVITGFCAMSSAAAMPMTILASEKNVSDPSIARSVVPASVNSHMLGDCLGIPIFAYAILKSFGYPMPGLLPYMVFCFYFTLTKFSAAGVPGGGVLVILPVLAAYLNFTPTMTSLLFSIYVLFDAVITSVNVLGNGAFALLIDRFVLISRRKE